MDQLSSALATQQILEIVVGAIASSHKSVYQQRVVHGSASADTLLTDEQAEEWLQADWAKRQLPSS